MTSSAQMDLFSSVISDIKTYAGSDPLRPWIKGIRKIHQGLPPHVVTEKLPRFLQKCAETFESHRRYRNDSRYIAVWIQLMDHVKEPRAILRKMEKSEIGMKRAEFYIAYAVYYVKKKRFEDAEKMYHLGVQNLAEPVEELQKSYDEFLRRMKLIKQRSTRVDMLPIACEATSSGNTSQTTAVEIDVCRLHRNALQEKSPTKENAGCAPNKRLDQPQAFTTKGMDESNQSCRDDMMMLKIADSGILGKSPAPNACHHGLLVPTVNMKESTDSICNMLKDALEQESISRSSNVGKSKSNHHGHAIQVFVDEDIEEPRGDANSQLISPKLLNPNSQKKRWDTDLQNPFVGAFKILADNDVADGDDEEDDGGTSGDCSESEEQLEAHWQTAWPANSEDSMESRTITSDIRFKEDTIIRKLREDTVIRKFVGSTVFDEPKVENACHHGLVDPTVNLKQAMDDINGMFGEPLNFVKVSKPKKKGKMENHKPSTNQSFFILTDDNGGNDLEEQVPKQAMDDINGMFGEPLNFAKVSKPKKKGKPENHKPSTNQSFFILTDDNVGKDLEEQVPNSNSYGSGEESGLFEPTIFTKEAMNEINELFGKPLEF